MPIIIIINSSGFDWYCYQSQPVVSLIWSFKPIIIAALPIIIQILESTLWSSTECQIILIAVGVKAKAESLTEVELTKSIINYWPAFTSIN